MASNVASSPIEIRCKGVLFDMDGILISSIGSVERSWTKWALLRGVDPEYACKMAHGRRAIETAALLRPDLDSEAELRLIEDIELADGHFFALVTQSASEMCDLIAMRRSRTLGRETNDETLDVPPQLQQHALAREIDRRDLEPVSRENNDKRIGREPADCLVNRRSPKAGHLLQILHGKESTGLEFAFDNEIFDPLAG